METLGTQGWKQLPDTGIVWEMGTGKGQPQAPPLILELMLVALLLQLFLPRLLSVVFCIPAKFWTWIGVLALELAGLGA